MNQETDESALGGLDFSSYIFQLNTQAMITLGSVPNPVTKKYERDLLVAQYLIDLIAMLQKKTKGNLTENEQQLIDNCLYQLRMQYVTAGKAAAEEREKKENETQPAPEETGQQPEQREIQEPGPTEQPRDDNQANQGEDKEP